MGAYDLLEACGGIEGWAMSARAEAQVGMLTWYEAHVADRPWVPADSPGWMQITSLVSGEDCVFPYAYFEAVLLNHNGREWDFFGLCGCPPSRKDSNAVGAPECGKEKIVFNAVRHI